MKLYTHSFGPGQPQLADFKMKTRRGGGRREAPAASGSAVGDRRSSGEYQVRISDNSEVTPAAGGGKFAKVSELDAGARSSPWRLAERGARGEAAHCPRPEMEFVRDHKMGIDYSSHPLIREECLLQQRGKG
jgi:hypothetical protein